MNIADRLAPIKPSLSFAVSAKARELKAKGAPVISLSIGEPDFDTPDAIKDAAIAALNLGFTKYTPIEGIPELRAAVVQKFKNDNQLEFSPDQILISCGAKQSLYNVLQASLNPGDEAIILAPFWPSYYDMVLLTGAKPTIINTTLESQFKITPDRLRAAITPKTRAVLLNSPSNPSGAIYSRSELLELGKVLNDYPDVLVITDDIYESIQWHPEGATNLFTVCPELLSRGVIIHGVSKAYAMTGWRIGFAAGPKPLITAMKTLQGQSTSGACSIAQKAATQALTGDQTCVKTMVDAFKSRHDYFYQALSELPGFECLPASGAFYLFPRVTQLLKHLSLKTDLELADYLITEHHLAVIPGSAFGTPDHLRLSFATSLASLEEAIARFKKIVSDF